MECIKETIFTSLLKLQHNGYEFVLDENLLSFEVDFFTQKSIQGVVEDHNILFEIKNKLTGYWVYESLRHSHIVEQIIEYSMLLEISMEDTVSCIEYLLNKDMLKEVEPARMRLGLIVESCVAVNQLYKYDSEFSNLRECSDMKINNTKTTLLLGNINTIFYNQLPEPLKKILELLFLKSTNYLKGVRVCYEKCTGGYRGINVDFVGYKNNENDSKLSIIRSYCYIDNTIDDCTKFTEIRNKYKGKS